MPRKKRTKHRHVSVITQFWDQVDRRGPDDCWRWLGGAWVGEPGASYGFFSFGGKHRELAHRFSLEIAVGSIGFKLALHRCDNPTCVNPSHLYAGNAKQNGRDMVERGRFPDHFEVYGRYLNTPLVEFMRQRKLGVVTLGKLLGVAAGTASRWLYEPRRSRISARMRDAILPVLGEELCNQIFDLPPEANTRLKILPEIEAAIVECKKSKMTARGIAKDFQVHYGTVHRVLRRNGLVKVNPRLSAVRRAWHRRQKQIA